MVGTGRDAYFGGNDIFAEVGVEDLGKPFPNAQTFSKGLSLVTIVGLLKFLDILGWVALYHYFIILRKGMFDCCELHMLLAARG